MININTPRKNWWRYGISIVNSWGRWVGGIWYLPTTS